MNDGTFETHSVGEEFGALQFASLRGLYGHQANAARSIISAVHAIAVELFLKGARRPEGGTPDGAAAQQLRRRVGSDPNDFRRPHHAFVIDGRRGSGKTTALLTLIPYLTLMRFGAIGATSSPEERLVAEDLASMALQTPAGVRTEHRIALVLPVVFTEDMEAQESTMEAVFALMEQELDEQLKSAMPPRKQELETLRFRLRSEVGVSWTYSRKIGVETLSTDAMDYKDFVNSRADLNNKAYTKVNTWRRFLDEYLDIIGYQVIVLLFDDSDLNPLVAEDIIRSIRMYLSHPRAISIVAVDMQTLHDTLVTRSLSELPVLRAPQLGEDGGNLESRKRRAIELEVDNFGALLDKVLPRPNRYRLTMGDLRHVDHFFAESNGDDEHAFSHHCRARFAADTPSGHSNLAWWLLDGPYRRMIAADLRGILAFRARTQDPIASPLLALLDSRALTYLASTTEHDLGIMRQLIDEGAFESFDGSEEALNTQEKRFLDLWMDVQIAEGNLRGQDTLAGLRWLSNQEDLASERRQLSDDRRTYGLPGVLRSELLPRNCLYFYQLRRLQLALEEVLPSASDFSRGLAALAQDPDSDHLAEAFAQMRGNLPGRARKTGAAREILDFIVTNLAALRAPRQFDVIFDEVDEDLIGKTARVAILLAAVVMAAPRPSHGDITAWFDGPWEAITKGGQLSNFISRLSNAVTTHERRRQEAIFVWTCANDIAAQGDDSATLLPRQARRNLADRASFTTEGRPRLIGLAKTSLERVSGSARQGLLLAWSLLPLIEPLHGFGTDYLTNQVDVDKDWIDVIQVLRRAREALGEDVLSLHDRAWIFADMSDETLARIVADVEEGAENLENVLRPNNAAGAGTMANLLTQSPASRLAVLLGTSEQWVKTNLGV